jgi:uncharacterized protein (TIRG00374 family)
LVLSIVCIYLAVRGISISELKVALQKATWSWVIVAVFVVLAGTFLKAWRWQALFYPERPGYGNVWSIFVIGQMLNILLPARAGEIGRIYFIGEAETVSRAKALSTVLVEKMVDLVMLAIAYLITAAWLASNPGGSQEWLGTAGKGLLPLAGLALGVLLLFAYAGRPTWRFLRQALNPLSLNLRTKANEAVEQAISGFEVLRHWRTSALVWGLSIMIWLLSTYTNVLIFNAYHINVSPWVALVLIVVLMSGVSVPPLPGNLGVFPYLSQLTLTWYGVDRETALVYGVTLQLVAYLPLVVVGLGSLLWQNWSISRSRSPAREFSHDEGEG